MDTTAPARRTADLHHGVTDRGDVGFRVTSKGGKERVDPVDGAFFAGLAAYLREERPAGSSYTGRLG